MFRKACLKVTLRKIVGNIEQNNHRSKVTDSKAWKKQGLLKAKLLIPTVFLKLNGVTLGF